MGRFISCVKESLSSEVIFNTRTHVIEYFWVFLDVG